MRKPIHLRDKNVDKFKVMETVCDYFNISVSDLKSKRRYRKISDPRQIVAYLLITDYDYTNIRAGVLLRRDHSTIIYSVKEVKNRLAYHNQTIRDIEAIRTGIKDVSCEVCGRNNHI